MLSSRRSWSEGGRTSATGTSLAGHRLSTHLEGQHRESRNSGTARKLISPNVGLAPLRGLRGTAKLQLFLLG
jgi:hypothetical protein